ncbi:hypothetical protein ACQ86D_35760 [Streptomyces galilaeus]
MKFHCIRTPCAGVATTAAYAEPCFRLALTMIPAFAHGSSPSPSLLFKPVTRTVSVPSPVSARWVKRKESLTTSPPGPRTIGGPPPVTDPLAPI